MIASFVFIFLIMAALGSVVVINIIHSTKYNNLMEYYRQHHPVEYEKLQQPRIFGAFSSSGQPMKTIRQYARTRTPTTDPVAEELLTNYIRSRLKRSIKRDGAA